MYWDTVITNATIITMNPLQPLARALALKGTKIKAVGKIEDLISRIGASTKVLDLRGGTVLPGFIDSHTHFLNTGLSLISLDLTETVDLTRILVELEVATKQQPAGTLIRGYGYDERKFVEKRPLTRQELDLVAPNHLVWLNRVDHHSSVVNSRLLQELNLPADLEGVEQDDQGEPTGLLKAEANQVTNRFVDNHLDPQVRLRALEIASHQPIAKGITTICAMESYAENVRLLLDYKMNVNKRIEIFYQTINVSEVLELGLPRIGGCVLVDGSFGSRTAALSKPYADDLGNKGFLYFTQKQLNDFIFKAHKSGLQIANHAIGDRAIEQIITAHEQAQRRYPRRNPRHRIEHFELPTPAHIKRAKALGLILSMQPAFEYYWGGAENLYGQRLGALRVNRTNPLREILDAGLIIAGGSDSSVTPMNPMYGIHGAVNHSNPMQQTALVEALKMFTINGAYALHLEKERGSIQVGKVADLVVMEENPFKVAPQHLKDLEVKMTFIDGQLVYSDGMWCEGAI